MIDQNTSEILTPRTDEQEFNESCNFDVPWSDFARQLERELAEVKAERDAAISRIKELIRYASHKDGCRRRYNENCSCGFEEVSSLVSEII